MRRRVSFFAIFGFGLVLTGCGTSNSQMFSPSALDLFNTSSKGTQANASATGQGAETETDIECPSVSIRNGAATLTISKTTKDAAPTALDVRYQGSIIRTARECHVSAGVMTMKVGIEGRIITGPAGGPGSVDVPMRIAIVQDGVEPKTIVSKFGRETVTIAGEVDRTTFTHIESDISFPLPQPLADIDSYVVYVGFDPLGEQPEKKKPAVKRKRPVKPKQSQAAVR